MKFFTTVGVWLFGSIMVFFVSNAGAMGGDTCSTASAISGIPFYDSGDTSATSDDYYGFCQWFTSNDVVYRFNASTTYTGVTIDLCSSGYDTSLYVRQGSCQGTEIGCSEDSCGVQSRLTGLNFEAGVDYYIFIDGFFSWGVYQMTITADTTPTPAGTLPPTPTQTPVTGPHCFTCPSYDLEIIPTNSYQTHGPVAFVEATECRLYRMNLSNGTTYRFTMCEGGGAASGGWWTTMTLYNASCVQVAYNSGYCSFGSQIDYSATSSGIYYLKIGVENNIVPLTYTLAYRSLGPTPTPTKTPTITQPPATPTVTASLTPSNSPTPGYHCFSCPAYDYVIMPSQTYQTHGPVSFSDPSECRMYQVQLAAGTQYRFTMCEGGGSASGWWTTMTLYNDMCTVVADNWNYCSYGSQIDFTPSSNGTWYLKVGIYTNTTTLTYTLAYRSFGPTPTPTRTPTMAQPTATITNTPSLIPTSSPTPGYHCFTCPAYDYVIIPSQTYQTHGPVSFVDPTECRIYQVQLTAGTQYRFTMCEGGGAAGNWWTTMTLYDSNCVSVSSNWNSCSYGSQIDYNPGATGTYYLQVGIHNNITTLTYTLAYRIIDPTATPSITPTATQAPATPLPSVTPTSTHTTTPAYHCYACPNYDFEIAPLLTYQTHGPVTFTNPTECRIYRMQLNVGTVYRFTMCEGGGSATGWWTTMNLFDNTCSVVASNWNYCSYGSQIDYTPSSDGTYYLNVGIDSNTTTLTYTLAYRSFGPTATPTMTPSTIPTVTPQTPTATPTLGPGNTCDTAFTIFEINLPFSDTQQTTCGREDDYSATCLNNHDSGEDIIYRLILTTPRIITITIDPKYNPYSAIALDDTCPPDLECIAYSASNGMSEHSINNVLLYPGAYYIMVDKWDVNLQECIPDFDLTITGVSLEEGDYCGEPIVVNQNELPFYDTSQTTCERFHVFENSCLQSGDDSANQIFYQLQIVTAIRVNILLNPNGLYRTSMTLDNSCPPDGTCIQAFHMLSPDPWGFTNVFLSPGTYYLMIGSHSIEGPCMPEFDLSITEWIPPPTPTVTPTVTPTPQAPSMQCPATTDYAQEPFLHMAWGSDSDDVSLAADSFSGITEPITAIRWWGLEAINSGGWHGCNTDGMYTITFYATGTTPGLIISQQTIYVSEIDTGVLFNTEIGNIKQFNANLDQSVNLSSGWVSIRGQSEDNCWFMWIDSPDGDGSFVWDSGSGWESVQADMAFCIIAGGVLPTPLPSPTPTPLPVFMVCESGAQMSQPPVVDQAYNSDGDAGYMAAELFTGLPRAISDVRWWGLELINTGGWSQCASGINFTIKIYEAGINPGNLLAERAVAATKIDTGISFGALGTIKMYECSISPPINITTGWLAIQGETGDACWFMWINSQSGDGASRQLIDGSWSTISDDLALCIMTRGLPITPAPTGTPAQIPATGPFGIVLLIVIFSGIAIRRKWYQYSTRDGNHVSSL